MCIRDRTWIAADWVRPERGQSEPRFSDADIARVRLIQELRQDMGIDEETLPLLLSLLDQLYASRRRLRTLAEAVAQEPGEVRQRITERYVQAISGTTGAGPKGA